jgi:hypothetical protein
MADFSGSMSAAFNIVQSTSPGEARPNLDDPQKFRYTPIAQPKA